MDIWKTIYDEIIAAEKKEPFITQLTNTLPTEEGFWGVLTYILSDKLATSVFSQQTLATIITPILKDNDMIRLFITTDLKEYFKRDFACHTYLEILLFSRGFLATCMYRISRFLFTQNQPQTAKFFHSRIIELYTIDIHPNAQIGKGTIIDHGIGIVIGETAQVGDYCVIFHQVTLGSTGHENGDRHPKIKDHVVIGTGAVILGNIHIADHVNIAAGSVVLKNVPPHTTVAGIPAKPVGRSKKLL